MHGPAGGTIARLIAVAVLAMLVGAIATIGAALLDRFEQPEIRVAPITPGSITAQVDGAVATPGVYTLPADARLVDLLRAAGGLRDDADVGVLNLAARVGDGESIEIPSLQQATPQAAVSSSGHVNINAADQAALETLPGIGPVLAERIIAERERNGPFETVDALGRVDGISASTVEELRPLVTTGD